MGLGKLLQICVRLNFRDGGGVHAYSDAGDVWIGQPPNFDRSLNNIADTR